MRRFDRSLALGVRAALFLGFWALLLAEPLSFLQLPGTTPAAWQTVAGAEESRSMPHKTVARLFEKRCLRCHDGDGSGREMRRTLPDVPDFTNPRWQRERNTTQLVVGILDGKGTRMPAFAGKVSQEQARDLAAYIRSLGAARARGARKPAKMATQKTAVRKNAAEKTEDDFDGRFRQLQKEFEQLRKQLQELSRKRKP
jgi:mono/diheme cytochrome c family protein